MPVMSRGGGHNYKKAFDQRGKHYHQAMLDCPAARSQEFHALFAKVNLKPGELILDIPSGGGYLEKMLGRIHAEDKIEIHSVEFSSGFVANIHLLEEDLESPVSLKLYDRIICLAASHHINDFGSFLQVLRARAKLGAVVHVADVVPGSNLSHFLDEFINRHTSTGHKGIYRDLQSFLWPQFLCPIHIEVRQYPWCFDNEDQMISFCRTLFGLNPELSGDLLKEALRNYVGFSASRLGIKLHWELQYCDLIVR